MNKPIIAVMGATGAQGGSVVDALLKAGKWKVRALTRDPKSARCDALREKGVDVVKAHAGNKEEIEKAFQGAHGVFAVTNFWDPEIYPNNIPEEERQGRLLADTAVAVGVKHYVWSSLCDADTASEHKVHVPHFSGKNRVEHYIRKTYPTLNATYFYPGFYMQNMLGFFKPSPLADGALELALDIPCDRLVPMIDVSRDTGPIVAAIFENFDKLQHQIVYGASEYVSMQQVVKSFSKATGKRWVYRYAEQRNPPKDETSQMMHWIGHYGYFNGASITATQAMVPHLTTFDQFAMVNPPKLLSDAITH